jgi:pimeloyl-ACP methyl ester carboxylesterase
MGRQLIYLHGFASSPGSNKARRFAEALQLRGQPVQIPDLNEGDFRGLTISRQLDLIDRLTDGGGPGSVVLIGSSMGAYVAALYAARSERVAALALMAPAFDFFNRWDERLSPEAWDLWRRRGAIPVLHHGTDQPEEIGFELALDARQHPSFPEVSVPTLVLHGRGDETVPYQGSERFAAGRDNVELELLDSDHGLGDQVEWILERVFGFLIPWLPRLAVTQPRQEGT